MDMLTESIAARVAPKRQERARFGSHVCGIPCQISVTSYLNVKPFRGPAAYCDSPDDYYGYTEIEFSVLDRRGRPAAWLERKVDQRERQRIEGETIEHMESES